MLDFKEQNMQLPVEFMKQSLLSEVAKQVGAITWRPAACNDTAFDLRASKNLYL